MRRSQFSQEADSLMSDDILVKMKELVAEHKRRLLLHYETKDRGDGCVSIDAWLGGLRAIVGDFLPWEQMIDDLVVTEADGSVKYRPFLSRYRVSHNDDGWQARLLSKLYSELAAKDLTGTLSFFDVNKDGVVTMDELLGVLRRFNFGIAEHSLDQLASRMLRGQPSMRTAELIDAFALEYRDIHGERTPPEWAAPLLQAVREGLPLPRLAKSLVVAGGYGSIAIPSSLPFAMFAMDFGKEGAAMLSSILSAVGFGASLLFLHLFPPLLKRHGWRGVYGTLAALGLTAALAMSSIMFSDYSKFSRGYIITSSLLNETVVTLHACEKCTFAPMWRPGARRTYSYAAAKRNYSPLRPHAPTRRCHLCGRRTVVECRVGEAFAELSLMTPYAQCDAWVRERTPLRKGDGGWAFADPTRYPLAPKKTYGDERAYQLRIAMERRAAEGIAEEATDEAVEAALGDTI